ncbi:MAG TPA: TolC family protein [Gemmatimonadaceae bacterium]|nr:TolC family protein [Gemmatimonadaceae bacterium]
MHTYSRTLIALLVGAAGVAGAQSPAPAGRTITLDDAIGIALQQNTAVRQAENASDLSAATVHEQKLQLLPSLNLNVNGANNLGRNFSQSDGAIVNQQTQSLNTGVSSSLTLFDGGKNVANVRAAQASNDAASQDLTRAKQTAVFTVMSNFVSLTNAQQQLEVQQENLKSLAAQEAQIQKLVDAGTRPIADLYQAQASVASAKLAVTQASNAIELAKVDLIQTLQLDPAATYDFVAPQASGVSAASYNLQTLITQAWANRADLDAQNARVSAAQQSVKAAAASKLPTVSVGASYSTGYSSAGNAAFTDQLNQRQGGGLSIGVSLPIFDKGASSLAEQRAQIDEENAQLALAQQKQQIALDVRRAYLNEQSAEQQLAAAQAQLTAAQNAVDATQKRYEVGAATLVEVTQSRAQQVQAASAVITAKNNLALQQAVMSYDTGSLAVPATASAN